MIWNLIPGKGIEKDNIQIFFGMNRKYIQQILGSEFGSPKSYREYEDDYETTDNTWIRLRFHGETLNDIEFINGYLEFDGIALHQGTRLDLIKKALSTRGHTFIPAFDPKNVEMGWLDIGHDCKTLGINIATRENAGGDDDDDSIEWVIASKRWIEMIANHD